MARRAPFTWEDVEHWYGRDLMDTLVLISDQDEADSFITAYAEACDDDDHALHNVRYMAQIIGGEDAERICEFFGLEIPTKNETITPRQWFKESSLGTKVEA
jgi:hypothetical protein